MDGGAERGRWMDGRQRTAEDGLSRLRGGGQAVHEWGTNKRMWTADRRPRMARWTAGQSVDDGRWTMDGRTAEDGLSRLRGGGQAVNEWGTNKRMWTQIADRGRRRTGKTVAVDGRWRVGFRCGRRETVHDGERINECGRQTADGGGWAFEASGRGASRQRMGNE
jgi:hypothetical protein